MDNKNPSLLYLMYKGGLILMEQKILADILDKTVEIDIKPTAKNLVLNFTFNKVTEAMIFTKDLGDIYQEKLKEYYIECASIRYSNCINRKKILNYKLNKFLHQKVYIFFHH